MRLKILPSFSKSWREKMNAKLQTLIQRYMRLNVMDDTDCPHKELQKIMEKTRDQIADYAIELAVEGRLFFSNRNGRVRQVKVNHNGKTIITKNPYIDN